MTSELRNERPRQLVTTIVRELTWILPTTAVTLFVIVMLLTSSKPEVLSAVIGVVLAVVGIAVSVALFRLPAPRGSSFARRPLGPKAHALSYTTSTILIGLSIVWPFSDDNPGSYFDSDELTVGINGELPGWSLDTGAGLEGFDIELAKYLQRAYGIEKITWVKLNQVEREHMWDGTLNKGPVDLVISAFSITDPRLAEFDMAGPYYIDVSMTLGNGDKDDARAGGVVRGCAVAGTTGQTRLATVQDRLAKVPGTTMLIDVPAKLSSCYNRFFGSGETKYIASDWSIIRAFNQVANLTAADADDVKLITVPEPDVEDSARQLYGVALRQGYPNVCKDLTAKLNDFIRNKWQGTFNNTLSLRGLPQDWHEPKSADISNCEVA